MSNEDFQKGDFIKHNESDEFFIVCYVNSLYKMLSVYPTDGNRELDISSDGINYVDDAFDVRFDDVNYVLTAKEANALLCGSIPNKLMSSEEVQTDTAYISIPKLDITEDVELNVLYTLVNVMEHFNDDMTINEVKRIAKWFHDKYNDGGVL